MTYAVKRVGSSYTCMSAQTDFLFHLHSDSTSVLVVADVFHYHIIMSGQSCPSGEHSVVLFRSQWPQPHSYSGSWRPKRVRQIKDCVRQLAYGTYILNSTLYEHCNVVNVEWISYHISLQDAVHEVHSLMNHPYHQIYLRQWNVYSEVNVAHFHHKKLL